MQLCPNPRCENALLDAFGNHALTCHPGIGSRKATLLEKSIERVYRKAGGRVERQPSTFRLLGEMFSKDDLMALFPGKMTVPEAKKNSELALELVDALTMVPSVKKDAIVEEIRTRIEIAAEAKRKKRRKKKTTKRKRKASPSSASTFVSLELLLMTHPRSSGWITRSFKKPPSPTKPTCSRICKTVKRRVALPHSKGSRR
jgi:hypothetical protein